MRAPVSTWLEPVEHSRSSGSLFEMAVGMEKRSARLVSSEDASRRGQATSRRTDEE